MYLFVFQYVIMYRKYEKDDKQKDILIDGQKMIKWKSSIPTCSIIEGIFSFHP
jgi:hypothetical protein